MRHPRVLALSLLLAAAIIALAAIAKHHTDNKNAALAASTYLPLAVVPLLLSPRRRPCSKPR